jgi:DNA topoisomerase-2
MASLSETYQMKSDKQHVLDNPDTYIGSVDIVEEPAYVYEDSKIVSKTIHLNPGLYKMVDEALVNARDHVVRMLRRKESGDASTCLVTSIEVDIDDGRRITLTNNGDGIDVEKHPEHGLWIPEMIFGHLRTSTNYNKEEQKVTGGKNGFGVKLALIWSTWGMVETVDARRGLKYSQVFENNLDVIHPPTVTPVSKKVKPYTKVSFEPDYARLKMDGGLTPDLVALFKRRVFDMSGVTSKQVKVSFNGEPIAVKDFEHYVGLYTGEAPLAYETHPGGWWTYAVALTTEEHFTQVSFVNGIFTSKGGKHVEYIVNQIVRKLCDYIEKKKKVKVSYAMVREHMSLFLNCTVENPSFDSQTKDYMTTPSTKFTHCEVSDKFIEKLANQVGLMQILCELNEAKMLKQSKRTDGGKTSTVRGIVKLVDANYAGTKRSNECTLILCEGDSAKAGIISGLTSADRNVIGVYPMKGKLLNVRGEALTKIHENQEIVEMKKILGLETGKVRQQHTPLFEPILMFDTGV